MNSHLDVARIAVHISPPPPVNRARTCAHTAYLREILAHARYPTDASFTEANLRAQHAWLTAATGPAAISNKNHYTRWEGRLQFFEWCERLGIQAEQSRGPSKLGCTGFLFGTQRRWVHYGD